MSQGWRATAVQVLVLLYRDKVAGIHLFLLVPYAYIVSTLSGPAALQALSQTSEPRPLQQGFLSSGFLLRRPAPETNLASLEM